MNMRFLVAGLLLMAPGLSSGAQVDADLTGTMKSLDHAMFDAFNKCADPQQLAKHGDYFAKDVEFYHDNGGVTWTREAMLENTRRNACGKYTRQLTDGTFKVSPIAGFGAITTGVHRFCENATGECAGEAEFTMVWRNVDGKWRVTRALSYGHRGVASQRDTSAAREEIAKVVEAFRTAIIEKNKPKYMALFFSNNAADIGWQFVSEDSRLVEIRKKKPDAIKARQIPANNFISLIDGVVASKGAREETFDNVQIDTDGEIASVFFDYAFLADGKKTNWGKEMWQLVRTEQGWKIFSVIYTIRDEMSAPSRR